MASVVSRTVAASGKKLRRALPNPYEKPSLIRALFSPPQEVVQVRRKQSMRAKEFVRRALGIRDERQYFSFPPSLKVAVKELKRFAKKLFPSLEVLDVIGGACVTARVERTKKYVFRTKTTTRASFPRRPSASLRSWTRSPPAPTLPRAGAATRQSARTRSEGLRVSESLFFSFCRYFPLPPRRIAARLASKGDWTTPVPRDVMEATWRLKKGFSDQV